MNTLERRSLEVGTMLLLVLVVLGVANTIATEVWLQPMVSGKNVSRNAPYAYTVYMWVTSSVLLVGHVVAYVKLMGAGTIRDKALVLLVLALGTVAYSNGVAWLINTFSENSVVHSAVGLLLPLRILGLVTAIVLITMLAQAARAAGGTLPKALSGTYVGVVVASFIVYLVGTVWKLVDMHSWFVEPDSTAAMVRSAVIGLGKGAYYLAQAIKLVALVIVLRLVK